MTRRNLNTEYFHIRYNLFRLDDVTLEQIREMADKGDRDAQYGIGRYLYVVRPEENSADLAYEYLQKSHAQGQADAAAALAIIYEEGNCTEVDAGKCARLWDESLGGGSIYGVIAFAHSLIYGTFMIRKDVDKALEIINAAIKEAALQDETLGYFHYLRAMAKEEKLGRESSADDYRRAIELGCVCAWRGYADALYVDNEGEIKDEDGYLQILMDGVTAGDCDSMTMYNYLMSLREEDKNGENHIATYKNAFRLGSNVAAFLIAETYRNGWNGLGESVENAWKWYVKGAERNQVDCLEAMHDMCYITHDIDLPIEKVDIIALLGARMGSPKLLRAAVAAYSEGRLTKYAAEMEQFHIPTFDGDEAEEEFPDDDGRFDAYV